MTVITKRKPGPERTGHDSRPPLLHVFIVEATRDYLRPGDRALCGTPWKGLQKAYDPAATGCVVCAELDRLHP